MRVRRTRIPVTPAATSASLTTGCTFNNVRSPNNAGSTAVVAPGATSLSSIAWLDLAAEPQVLHVPEVTDHFFVLALIDPCTENVVNLGTAMPATWCASPSPAAPTRRATSTT